LKNFTFVCDEVDFTNTKLFIRLIEQLDLIFILGKISPKPMRSKNEVEDVFFLHGTKCVKLCVPLEFAPSTSQSNGFYKNLRI
jgi:hypothetical protein